MAAILRGDELRYADNIELQYIKYRCYLARLD